PDYRAERSHEEFLANLPLSELELRSLVACAFGAEVRPMFVKTAEVARLVLDRYGRDEWTFRL
ncbi:MAG: lipoate--protein ligase family protein, partial [Planctomycetaceae bacterium]